MSETTTVAMTKGEFCWRFILRMIERAGEAKFEDGTNLYEYAVTTAPTYWDEPDQREEGPEECADADMSYWGDE